MSYNVVSKQRLREFSDKHPRALNPLNTWHHVVTHASWSCFADVKRTYRSADLVGDVVVFDVHLYRVIVSIAYQARHVYIKHVFTHAEYDRWNATNR